MSEFFWRMKPAEAKAFFDEYQRACQDRLGVLVRSFNHSTGEQLDFSPASLVQLWRWAIPQLRERRYTAAEKEEEERDLPDWFKQINQDSNTFTDETWLLINDVAFYFAEVCRRNFQGISWAIGHAKVKRYVDENQPVLVGFKEAMNPRDIAIASAGKAIDGVDGENGLKRVYDYWASKMLT